MEFAANILETLMIVGFGISWPINVSKSLRSRTAVGKSILFDYLVFFGYICGITGKILAHNFNLAFWFYFPNLIMVFMDIVIYYHNKKLDAQRAKAEQI